MGTSLDDGTLELDRLFAEVARHPFRDLSPHSVPGEIPSSLADALDFGSLHISGGGSTGNRLVNGTFISGPGEDEDAVIDDEDNNLPEWEYVEVAGNWQVTWIDYANAPDDKALQFTQSSGSVSDEVYFEQTVPIDYYRRFVTTVKSVATDAGMNLKIAVRFLDTTGTAVGAEVSGTFTGTALAVDRFWREPPNLAVYARVRFGCVNSTGVDNETRTVLFITTEEPTVYSVNIPYVYSFLSPAINTEYILSHPSDIIPNGIYLPDTQGFVIGLSAKTSDTIAAGTVTFSPHNDTQAIYPDPSAVLSAGVTAATARTSLDGVSTYDFDVSDALSLRAETNGSYASTGGADYYGSIRLLLVVNDEGDW